MSELNTLARPYAKAAFQYAAEADAIDRWFEMLNLLAAVTAEAAVKQMLKSPNLTPARQVEILQSLVADELDGGGANLVTVLGRNRRLLLLPVIRDLFSVMKANREKSVEVEVKSATPIEETQKIRLAEALGKRLDRSVNITITLDQSLLGGALIRAGDTIIDGSIRGRLNRLAEALNS